MTQPEPTPSPEDSLEALLDSLASQAISPPPPSAPPGFESERTRPIPVAPAIPVSLGGPAGHPAGPGPLVSGGLDASLAWGACETPSAAPGWFGKLSMLGDFAHRRLPDDFISVCDEWLSAGMAASRVQMDANRWLDAYLTGPLWRFAWAPGVAGESWWFGVMMPSVDKVGRYFPLVVARSAPQPPQSLMGFQVLDDWFEQVGAALLATLQPGAMLEVFDAALGRLPSWDALLTSPPQRRPNVALLAGRERCTLDGAANLTQWLVACGSMEALQRCAGHSLWWPDHGCATGASLSIAPGLPDAEHFSLLLQGIW